MRKLIKRLSVDVANQLFEVETEDGKIYNEKDTRKDIEVTYKKTSHGVIEDKCWFNKGLNARKREERRLRKLKELNN
jgi:hypothetical protein